MKVFVSWSGELSKKVAAELHDWLPLLMDNIEVFYSPEDIEKGENWNQRLSTELTSCNYGLVCLTPENLTSVWINFEAGAIVNALDSRLAALLIGLNPSELKGPISKYQATQITKEEFLQLIQDMNKRLDSPIDESILVKRFNGLWAGFESKLQEIIKKHPAVKGGKKVTEKVSSDATEEILQLVRKQNAILQNPEMLLPQDYLLNVLNERFDSLKKAFASRKNVIRPLVSANKLFIECFRFLDAATDFLNTLDPVIRSDYITKLNLLTFSERVSDMVDYYYLTNVLGDKEMHELNERFSYIRNRLREGISLV